jgi:1-acyl-sn-glycerol-3-phosphate acyltransferase
MSGNENPPKPRFVNVRKVFKNKNPKLAGLLPGFVYKYLEKIAHQDDINSFLERHGHKYGVDFARAAIKEFNMVLEVKGAENIPGDKRCIFASNHPYGGFDGILLMDVMSRYYSEFRLLSNDILMNIDNLVPLFLPINKHGRQAVDSAGKLHEAYLSGMQIVTFPAGLVSRRINGQIIDLDWKKNFITKAVNYKRDVIPVHCTGRNSDFFYRLANLRKFLGIKSNIEMLYLVDETFRHRNEKVIITFGTPISYDTFDQTRTPVQWAKWVKDKSYALAGITHVPF